jgi:RNA polymerase sigma-70 factor (ECF subfamily)
MQGSPSETGRLLERLRARDPRALDDLFRMYGDHLRRMVELRLDWRLRARIDVSDVLREAHGDAAARLEAYLRGPELTPLLWLRSVVVGRLEAICRLHPGSQVRLNGSEISLRREAVPMAMSAALASMLVGRPTSSTAAAVRAERLIRLEEALNTLDPPDREVLALRHFERLSRAETALVLGTSEQEGARRYIHALSRLKEVIGSMPGLHESM